MMMIRPSVLGAVTLLLLGAASACNGGVDHDDTPQPGVPTTQTATNPVGIWFLERASFESRDVTNLELKSDGTFHWVTETCDAASIIKSTVGDCGTWRMDSDTKTILLFNAVGKELAWPITNATTPGPPPLRIQPGASRRNIVVTNLQEASAFVQNWHAGHLCMECVGGGNMAFTANCPSPLESRLQVSLQVPIPRRQCRRSWSVPGPFFYLDHSHSVPNRDEFS
jgi:hypothetical protein